MFTLVRYLFAAAYLGGTFIHLYNGARQPQVYRAFGDTALLPGFSRAWNGFFMPGIRFFAPLMAALELFMAVALLAGGRIARLGVAMSIAFDLFLVQLGLAFPAPTRGRDFLANRLPSLLMAAIQLPLLGMELRALGGCRENSDR